jgi:hypothetical protein
VYQQQRVQNGTNQQHTMYEKEADQSALEQWLTNTSEANERLVVKAFFHFYFQKRYYI